MSIEAIGGAIITFVFVVASRTTTIYNFCKIVGESLRVQETRRVATAPKE